MFCLSLSHQNLAVSWWHLYAASAHKHKWATSWQNQQNGMCAQQRLRSDWPAQSDQSLRCPHEESLCPQLPIERKGKTLIRLGGCPGWSESLLGIHVILLVLSWGGSNSDKRITSIGCLFFCDFDFGIYCYDAMSRVWHSIRLHLRIFA